MQSYMSIWYALLISLIRSSFADRIRAGKHDTLLCMYVINCTLYNVIYYHSQLFSDEIGVEHVLYTVGSVKSQYTFVIINKEAAKLNFYYITRLSIFFPTYFYKYRSIFAGNEFKLNSTEMFIEKWGKATFHKIVATI